MGMATWRASRLHKNNIQFNQTPTQVDFYFLFLFVPFHYKRCPNILYVFSKKILSFFFGNCQIKIAQKKLTASSTLTTKKKKTKAMTMNTLSKHYYKCGKKKLNSQANSLHKIQISLSWFSFYQQQNYQKPSKTVLFKKLKNHRTRATFSWDIIGDAFAINGS